MTTVLVDHNMKGQAALLWGILAAEGWLALLPLQLVTFAEIGLSLESSDRAPDLPLSWFDLRKDAQGKAGFKGSKPTIVGP